MNKDMTTQTQTERTTHTHDRINKKRKVLKTRAYNVRQTSSHKK